jgi:hypothetical protein
VKKRAAENIFFPWNNCAIWVRNLKIVVYCLKNILQYPVLIEVRYQIDNLSVLNIGRAMQILIYLALVIIIKIIWLHQPVYGKTVIHHFVMSVQLWNSI